MSMSGSRQLSLRSVFSGSREKLDLPEHGKRPVGRPRKVRPEVEEPEAKRSCLSLREGDVREPAIDLDARGVRERFSLSQATEVAEACKESLVSLARVPGKRLRRDEQFGLSERLRFCEWFKKREPLAGRPKLLSFASQVLGRSVALMSRVLADEGKIREALRKRGLTSTGFSRSEAQRPKWMRQGQGRSKGEAVRRVGAGRKDYLSFLYPLVKEYFLRQRERGRVVFPEDLRRRFMLCLEAYEANALEVEHSGQQLSELEKHRLELVRDRRHREERASKYAVRWSQRTLMRACGAVLRTPQRLVPLTLSQERERAVASWRHFDHQLWMSLGRDEEALADKVAKPEEWRGNLEQTDILMSDQIPIWVKIGRERQLYEASEVKPSVKEKRGERVSETWGQAGHSTLLSDEGTCMTRQEGLPEQGRYRVTLELTQCLSNWFKKWAEPVARSLKPVLIVPGAYGRLSNISPEGTYLKNEVFVVRGKEVRRLAGHSCGNLLKPWRDLRDHGTPEQRAMLEKLSIMSQPAGFTDGVIVSWIIEELAEQSPQCLHLRDAYAAAASESAVRASFLSHQIRVTIAGKMTPVLQVTDTDLAAPLKRAIERVKRAMMARKAEEADARGAPSANFRCDCMDILELVVTALEHVDELNRTDKLILSSMRRNGWLHYKPDLEDMRLVPTSEAMSEHWLSEFPEGSHRYPYAWLKLRAAPLDEKTGEPEKPEWQKCGPHVRDIEDMLDDAPEQGPDEEIPLKCHPREVFKAPSVELDLGPEATGPMSIFSVLHKVDETLRRRHEELLRTLPHREAARGGEKADSSTLSRKMSKRDAYRTTRNWRRRRHLSFRDEVKSHALSYSRKQLLSSIVPRAREATLPAPSLPPQPPPLVPFAVFDVA